MKTPAINTPVIIADTIATSGDAINVTETARRQLVKAGEVAENTRKAQETDLKKFVEYCDTIGNAPSALALVEYLANQSATLKISTLRRKFANLSKVYTLTSEQRQQVNTMLRKLNHAQKVETNKARKDEANSDGTQAKNFATKQAPAISKSDLLSLIAGIDTTNNKGARNAAMLALAFFGGLRGSELIAVRVENITATADNNIKIELLDTKTAENADIYIYNQFAKMIISNYVAKVKELRSSGELFTKIDKHGNITGGAITRQSWHRIVKGFDEGLQTHSFRRGAITELIRCGAPLNEGMQFSRHADKNSFMRYVDTANSEKTNGGKYL